MTLKRRTTVRNWDRDESDEDGDDYDDHDTEDDDDATEDHFGISE